MIKLSIFITLMFMSSFSLAQDFKSQLNGKRLYVAGAKCGGISLEKNAGIYSEVNNCEFLPTRVIWATEDTFFLTQKKRMDEINPPIHFIYKVVSINGKNVTLKALFTVYEESNLLVPYVIR